MTELVVPFDGEEKKLSGDFVSALLEKLSRGVFARGPGDAAERLIVEVCTRLPEDVSPRPSSGKVLERGGVPLPSKPPSPDLARAMASFSDTIPGALPDEGLKPIPCATLASLSLTFVGDNTSFLGGGGVRVITGDAGVDEWPEEGSFNELMSMRGLGGIVLVVEVDIALPGLRA